MKVLKYSNLLIYTLPVAKEALFLSQPDKIKPAPVKKQALYVCFKSFALGQKLLLLLLNRLVHVKVLQVVRHTAHEHAAQ